MKFPLTVSVDMYEDESFLLGTMGHELLHASLDNNLSSRGGHSEEFMKFAEKLYDRGIYANLFYSLVIPMRIGDGEKAKVHHCECGINTVFIEPKDNICPICGKEEIVESGQNYVPSFLV